MVFFYIPGMGYSYDIYKSVITGKYSSTRKAALLILHVFIILKVVC
jgi:hypothetical protein